jgi:antitoxin (DNA-binding transcriptional repressor) of toxin-antitoxin stability system
MTTVSIREFSHNMSKYLKKLRAGEGFILKYRNEPIAQVLPSKPAPPTVPGWKRYIKKIKLKGDPLSETVVKMRREDWR